MSKLRTYRCVPLNKKVHLNDLIAIMRELGLNPQLHNTAKEVKSYLGDTTKTLLTWDASCIGKWATRSGGAVVFQTDKNGYLVGTPGFICDSYTARERKKHRKLVDAISRALNQSAKTVTVPIAAGLTVQEVQQVARYLGAQVNGQNLQIARPIQVNIPTGIKERPHLTREIPAVVEIRAAPNGAVSLVLPEQVLQQHRPAVENLKRLAIGLVTVKAQAAQAAWDETVIQPVVFVNPQTRQVSQVDVDWVRDDLDRRPATVNTAKKQVRANPTPVSRQEEGGVAGEKPAEVAAVAEPEVTIAEERQLGLPERLHMDPERSRSYAAQLATQAKQQGAAVFAYA